MKTVNRLARQLNVEQEKIAFVWEATPMLMRQIIEDLLNEVERQQKRINTFIKYLEKK